jgi:hypothetical protein
MKLKSLKFVLPILLVLPSLVFADYHYWRTPEGTEITSPVTLHFDWLSWDEDVCDGNPECMVTGEYWEFYLKISNSIEYYGEIHDKTTKEATESFNLPVGTKISDTGILILDEMQGIVFDKVFEWSYPPNYVFEIVGTSTPPSLPPSGTIGNTQNWLSSNEILAYIGKLAEDIPNYIALMIGLPIAFWFVEKIIAFVRGNFRPAEKIKEE